MKRLLTVFAAVVCLGVGIAAQDSWEAQVRRLLSDAGKSFEQRGFSLSHNIYTGSLDEDESENVRFDLDIAKTYQIIGACDTDCDDLDLVLYDPRGNEIDSDLLEDDFPIVATTPTRSGSYSVKVVMAGCDSEPCRYGIGIFAK